MAVWHSGGHTVSLYTKYLWSLISPTCQIKKIDLNKSLATEFVLDKEENCIICPFSALDGLGDTVAESIVMARNDQPFSSVEDLIKRTKITKQHIEKLKELHVLDDLSQTNQMSLFDL